MPEMETELNEIWIDRHRAAYIERQKTLRAYKGRSIGQGTCKEGDY